MAVEERRLEGYDLLRLDPDYIGSCPCASFEMDGTRIELHCWRVCHRCQGCGIHFAGDRAVAVTRYIYGEPPAFGMVTFIDPTKTRKKRDPGRCYLRAGFRRIGMTKGGLVVVQQKPEDMPDAAPPLAMGIDQMAMALV